MRTFVTILLLGMMAFVAKPIVDFADEKMTPVGALAFIMLLFVAGGKLIACIRRRI